MDAPSRALASCGSWPALPTDIFNEMEIRRNGEDIKAKLRNKALNAGTISRAKLGYLNTRAEQDGRLFNSIALDERRAPLVLKAFELYAMATTAWIGWKPPWPTSG